MRILSFFGLLALAAVATDSAITQGLRRIKTSQFGSSNAIMSGRVNAEIVISGSSRALVHYDPRVLQAVTGLSAYNLGRNAAQTDMEWAFLKAYLKHNAKPRIVLHNLDAHSLTLTKEIYDPAQYLPYLYEEEIYQPLSRIQPSMWKSKYLPLYGYAVEDMRFTWMLGLRGLVGLNPREDFALGFNGRGSEWTGDFERFKAANPQGTRMEIQPEAVELLEELICTCKKQGMMVVLVYSPEYREAQAMTVNRKELFDQFGAIARRCEIAFWDYSDSDICGDRALFYNSQHLNMQGAAKFTADLAGRLVRLIDGEGKTARTSRRE